MKASDTGPEWREAVCIASGPSLTQADCDLVRDWHAADRARGVIVVNNSYQLARWADVLYAMDLKWWNQHGEQAAKDFRGRKLTVVGRTRHAEKIQVYGSQNSGHGAATLAMRFGATRIILLGYDCQRTAGKTHWHGDHGYGLGNAGSLHKWPAQFRALAAHAKSRRITIINCSRETALTCFPRQELEIALCSSMECLA